jgi:hypothetical protein
VTHISRLTTEQAALDTQRVQTFYRENLGLIYRYVYSKMVVNSAKVRTQILG